MKITLTMALLLAGLSSFAAAPKELLRCPVIVNGNAGDVQFPQRGDLITHTLTNGNLTTTAITVTFGKTLQMEEHLRFQDGKLTDFYQFRPAPPFGNKEYKWVHMKVDRSQGMAKPQVWVIRAKSLEDFDQWMRDTKDPKVIAYYKAQKEFFAKYHNLGVSNIVTQAPFQAAWIKDMKPEISMDRTSDQAPMPFSEDLKDGFHTLFVSLKNQTAPALIQQFKFFTISKDQQIWPTRLKGVQTGNSVNWESTLKIGTDIDLNLKINHVTQSIENFTLKAGALGSWIEAKNESGCQKL